MPSPTRISIVTAMFLLTVVLIVLVTMVMAQDCDPTNLPAAVCDDPNHICIPNPLGAGSCGPCTESNYDANCATATNDLYPFCLAGICSFCDPSQNDSTTNMNSVCSQSDPLLPFCIGDGSCVECLSDDDNADGTNATCLGSDVSKPFCRSNVCTQCRPEIPTPTNTDCATNPNGLFVCGSTSGMCERCDSSTNCVFGAEGVELVCDYDSFCISPTCTSDLTCTDPAVGLVCWNYGCEVCSVETCDQARTFSICDPNTNACIGRCMADSCTSPLVCNTTTGFCDTCSEGDCTQEPGEPEPPIVNVDQHIQEVTINGIRSGTDTIISLGEGGL